MKNYTSPPFVIVNNLILIISFFLILTTPLLSQCPLEVTTAAGDGTSGFMDGAASTAQFKSPFGVAVDANGNIFIADLLNHRIRKIDGITGNVSTFAGSGTLGFQDGAANTARFNAPAGVAVDASGNVYVADRSNHRIRKIDVSTMMVSTLAGSGTFGFQDGDANTAQFKTPIGVAVGANGNVYVTDFNNNRIRKIDVSTMMVSTLAGDGTSGFMDGVANTAQFRNPSGVAIDASGNVYVADFSNQRIRMIDVSTMMVSTLAGSGTEGFQDGDANTAQFKSPTGVAVDASGNVYVGDQGNHLIRKIDVSTMMVSTLAGSGTTGSSGGGFMDGVANTAKFSFPTGVAIDASGNVFVADSGNNRIRKIACEEGCTNVADCIDGLEMEVTNLGLPAVSNSVLSRILLMVEDRLAKNSSTGAINLLERFKILVDSHVTNAADAMHLKDLADDIIAEIP